MKKVLTVILVILVLAIALPFVFGGVGSSDADKEPTKEELLDTHCQALGQILNATYSANNIECLGSAYDEDTALFAVYLPYTTADVVNLYANDKDSFHQLWVNISSAAWDYCADQGVTGFDVNVQFYAADNEKECVVYATVNDTKLMN